MKLLSIQIGQPRTLGEVDAVDPQDRRWTTAFYKAPVQGAIYLERTKLSGDGQADLQNHGGFDKAVCAYSKDHWPYWETDLGLLLPHGAFGENFTLGGAVEKDVCVGDIFQCGPALLQVSQPREPCWKLARRWRVKELAARVQRTGRTGWYFRVMREGVVEAPADLRRLERPYPEWTIAAANAIMHHRNREGEAARALAACPALSESWRATLTRPAAG